MRLRSIPPSPHPRPHQTQQAGSATHRTWQPRQVPRGRQTASTTPALPLRQVEDALAQQITFLGEELAYWAREFDDAALLRLYDQRQELMTILATLRR